MTRGIALLLAAAVVLAATPLRAATPCPPVDLPQLALQAAAEHAADMAGHAALAHRGSDGSQGGERLAQAGDVWSSWGENLGQGHRSVPALVASRSGP